MVRLAALFALGLSATMAVPLEPSFAPFPVATPDVGVELIPAASMEPLAFDSHTMGTTPEPVSDIIMPSAEPGFDIPMTTTEPGAMPRQGVEPLPETTPAPEPGTGTTPFVSPEPVTEPMVDASPEATAAPVVVDKNLLPFTFNAEGSPEATPAPDAGSAVNATAAAKKPVNEGCVAVEHLEGYVLQHKNHLTRDVLCADGFCATPNHAIIVDGVYTSMKQLCESTWKCTQSVKLVNNLKVWANSRAVVNEHITVTPYDVRFPKVASWVAQVAEALYDSMSVSMVALFSVAAAMAMTSGKSKLA